MAQYYHVVPFSRLNRPSAGRPLHRSSSSVMAVRAPAHACWWRFHGGGPGCPRRRPAAMAVGLAGDVGHGQQAHVRGPRDHLDFRRSPARLPGWPDHAVRHKRRVIPDAKVLICSSPKESGHYPDEFVRNACDDRCVATREGWPAFGDDGVGVAEGISPRHGTASLTVATRVLGRRPGSPGRPVRASSLTGRSLSSPPMNWPALPTSASPSGWCRDRSRIMSSTGHSIASDKALACCRCTTKEEQDQRAATSGRPGPSSGSS